MLGSRCLGSLGGSYLGSLSGSCGGVHLSSRSLGGSCGGVEAAHGVLLSLCTARCQQVEIFTESE